MFLKSIEIRGFKSFADKTELTFKKGVTAVVGPNGSGKSNISDAVRWVLGEQSVKSLRGGKMEDVIFAGTQFRKPVGLAQVSLTLDNSDNELAIDYSDVTISRRLYRSGESEYYINNTQCRLKDIHELFMDTGIGKEGYSIIGQGKIDAILSGKPEERRGLLEEAAGIVKFKSRKEEAEKRLENTEQNLVRINDILTTYEERLEPLRIENEKAKVFLRLSGQLTGKEVNILLHSIQSCEDRMANLHRVISNIEENTKELLKEKDKYRIENIELNKKLEDHEEKFEKDKQFYYDSKSKLEKLNAETSLLKERIGDLTVFINKTSNEINELTSKNDKLIIDKNEYELNLNAFKEKQNLLNSEIEKYENILVEFISHIASQELEVKRLKEDEIDILNNISELKNNIMLLKNHEDIMKKKIEQLTSACDGYVNSLKINTNTKNIIEEEICKIKDNIINLESNISSNKNQITKLNYGLTSDERKLKDMNISFNKLEANYHMLNNLDKQYEGYNKAVKNLMQDIEKGKAPASLGQCQVLGEVIKVEKELEVAIEIALGGSISDIITSDEYVAKNLIEYLKQNKLGRATFLPLTIIKGRKLKDIDEIKNEKGFLGIASELINYDIKFKNAIEQIIGRTVICSDMDSALKIAKKTNFSYKIVTLSGEIINPGGALTGGSLYHKNANVIGRKREIEDINKKISELKVEIDAHVSNIESKKTSIKKLDDMCLNLRDEIYQQNIEVTKLTGKINAIDSESEKLKQNINISTNELAATKEQLRNNEDEISSKENSIKELSLKENENENKICEIELWLDDKKNAIQDNRDNLTALKIEKAQLDEIVINKIKELERLDNDMKELLSRRMVLEKEVSEAIANKESSLSTVNSNDVKIKSIELGILKFEEHFKDSELEKIKLKESIKVASEAFEGTSIEYTKKEEEKHRQMLVLAKAETEKEGYYQKLNEELNLTYAEALKYHEEIQNYDELKREIHKLKSEITALGVVNVGAIEEYEEVREKFNFMSTQKEDLIMAKDELLSVIEEMTDNMKKVFNENFAKLRENFNETFKELFKGGRADLILAEGDELNANIDINVEPPGKKLQNINLMSGGEKVLSAIALLFAILKMKPTPFCILDEIEAALDDANVFRYAEFLKKFSHNIQFIVITHRKGTMEASDVLYGVTMEEKGVSKIVSVDLNKAV